jgi:hypothetical protein
MRMRHLPQPPALPTMKVLHPNNSALIAIGDIYGFEWTTKSPAELRAGLILVNPKYLDNLAAAIRAGSCFDVDRLLWTGSRFDPSAGALQTFRLNSKVRLLFPPKLRKRYVRPGALIQVGVHEQDNSQAAA